MSEQQPTSVVRITVVVPRALEREDLARYVTKKLRKTGFKWFSAYEDPETTFWYPARTTASPEWRKRFCDIRLIGEVPDDRLAALSCHPLISDMEISPCSIWHGRCDDDDFPGAIGSPGLLMRALFRLSDAAEWPGRTVRRYWALYFT